MHQNAPPLRLNTLKHWSARYRWQIRAEEYDAQLDLEKNAIAKEIMETGLALAYKRVVRLRAMAELLEGQIYAADPDGRHYNVWLEEVKIVGTGTNAKEVSTKRFNAPLIQQYRGVLDDLAKETGGRVHKASVPEPTRLIFTREDAARTSELLEQFRQEMAERQESMDAP